MPNREVKHESRNDEGGGGVSEEGKGERKKKGGGRRRKRGRKERSKRRKKVEFGKKVFAGIVNHPTIGVDVDNGVFRRRAEEAGGGLQNSEVKLVAHTTGGGRELLMRQKW